MDIRKVLFIVVACLVSGWWLTRTSTFRLREIRVTCEDGDLAQDVQRRLVGYQGRDLYRLSLAEIEKEVRGEPRVRRAFVRRVWPSLLRIEVEPRSVVGLQFREARLWMIDETGVAFAPILRPVSRPLLIGFESAPEKLREAAEWLAALPKLELDALDVHSLNEIHWKADRGFVARSLETDLEIELGYASLERGIRNANKALTLLKSRQIRANVLDASYVRRVVVRPRAASLQNPPHGLNLKEMEQRGADAAPAVR